MQGVTVGSSCVENIDFETDVSAFDIAGTLTIQSPLYPDWNLNIVITNQNGVSVQRTILANYRLHLVAGTYTITAPPELQPETWSGYSITPASRTLALSGTPGPLPAQDFVVSPDPYVVSGIVSGFFAPPSTGYYYPDTLRYNVVLSDGRTQVARYAGDYNTSDNYAFTGVPDGTYTISMEPRTDVTFAPASQQVTVSGGNVSGLNFVASPPPHRIFGTISSSMCSPRYDVHLSDANGVTAQIDTGQGTMFEFPVHDGTYTLTPSPSSSQMQFEPPSRVVVVNGADVTSQDFTCVYN